MNENQIRYFKALYELPNIRAAARSIPLSRQGLLKSLESTERELNVQLFDDIKGAICTPTAYGDAFYEYACEHEEAFRKLEVRFRDIKANADLSLSLCSAIGVRGVLGIDLFKSFEAQHPGIAIHCDEQPDVHCDESLFAGSCLLAFTVFPYESDFETTELYSHDRLVWVSRNDPLAREESIGIEDLEGYQVGLVGPSFKNYTDFLRQCEEHDVKPTRIDTFSEMSLLYDYACRPGRVSFTARSVADLFDGFFQDATPPVKAIVFKGMPWRFGISYSKDHSLSYLEYQFIQHCRNRMAAKARTDRSKPPKT